MEKAVPGAERLTRYKMVSKETKEKMRIKRGLRRPARDKAPTPAAMIVTFLETNSIEGHVLLVDHSHEGMPPLQWGQVASTPKRTSKSTAKSIKRLGDIVPKQTKSLYGGFKHAIPRQSSRKRVLPQSVGSQ
jgi:hypothetical protein